MKPVIKYPGGKTQLLEELTKIIKPLLKEDITFYEPFIGGGAVAFSLLHSNTVINDVNSELINLYLQIKEKPEDVIKELSLMAKVHNEQFYYSIRNLDRDPIEFAMLFPVERAARLLYLNHTCFNGLYRVNKKGQFNTPFGRTSSGKTPNIVNDTEIRELSTFLQNVKINCGDYKETLQSAKSGDVIYLDPPYSYENTNGFVSYTSDGWNNDKLTELKNICDELIAKNCYVIISNNSTTFVNTLFTDDQYVIREVDAKRNINCDGTKRTAKEVIIYSKNILELD